MSLAVGKLGTVVEGSEESESVHIHSKNSSKDSSDDSSNDSSSNFELVRQNLEFNSEMDMAFDSDMVEVLSDSEDEY